MTVGERIREARLKAHMTQAELAKKINTSYVVISQYENNKRNPKIQTIEKIATALDIPTTMLVPGYKSSKEMLDKAIASIANAVLPEAEREKIADHFFDGSIQIDTSKASDVPLPEQLDQLLQTMKRIAKTFPSEERLWIAFQRLNATGQEKAIERVEELGKIPEYQKVEEPEEPDYE